MNIHKTRRDFIKESISAAACLTALSSSSNARAEQMVPRKKLGRTDEMVSMLGLGGWHLGNIKEEKEAADAIQYAIDRGVNFFDCAVSYHEGGSESRYGRLLKEFRKNVFIMTKSTQRTRTGFDAELHGSLERMQTDYIDLYQFHSMRENKDIDTIFGPDGAMEAAAKAQKEGKIRYLGMTSHVDPNLLLYALGKWDGFITMQMPINLVDPHYLSNLKIIVPELVKRNIAVLAMKTNAAGSITKQNVATIQECLRFVWSQPVTVLISGCESFQHVKENIQSAIDFKPMTGEEVSTLLARTASHKGTGVESYKRKL